MDLTTLILIIGGAWLLQYGLTFIQIHHYRAMMRKLLDDYRDKQNFYLFSGVSRKPFSAGGIVAMVVNQEYEVEKCYVLSGYTVFSRFKPYQTYDGKHIGHVLADAHERIEGNKQQFMGNKSLAKAFMMAAENAVRSISNKRNEHSLLTQTQIN